MSEAEQSPSCSYEGCKRPRESSQFFQIEEGNNAGQKDWTQLVGRVLCFSCYLQFQTRGTLERTRHRQQPPAASARSGSYEGCSIPQVTSDQTSQIGDGEEKAENAEVDGEQQRNAAAPSEVPTPALPNHHGSRGVTAAVGASEAAPNPAQPSRKRARENGDSGSDRNSGRESDESSDDESSDDESESEGDISTDCYDQDGGAGGGGSHTDVAHDSDPFQAMHAIARRLSNKPCPKGGTAVSGVQVKTKQQGKGSSSEWRCSVVANCRRKKKSKEKPGEKRCLAEATHKVKVEAQSMAAREAVDVLRSIESGKVDLRFVSNKQKARMERAEAAKSACSGPGQPGWRVLVPFIKGNASKKKKRRVSGEPRGHTFKVQSPHGKEAQYQISMLRGLLVKPGDRLVFHQPVSGKKKARGFFTRDACPQAQNQYQQRGRARPGVHRQHRQQQQQQQQQQSRQPACQVAQYQNAQPQGAQHHYGAQQPPMTAQMSYRYPPPGGAAYTPMGAQGMPQGGQPGCDTGMQLGELMGGMHGQQMQQWMSLAPGQVPPQPWMQGTAGAAGAKQEGRQEPHLFRFGM